MSGGHLPLVVECSASVNVAAVARRAEGRETPFGQVHFYRVGMAQQQNRTLRPIALEARDEIRTRRILGGDDDRNSFGLQDLLDIFDGLGLVSGRIGGVDADQRLVVAQ